MLKIPTPKTETQEIYADFPMSFEVSPLNGDLLRKTNEEAVKESIRNLIMTSRGERLFQPDIGSDIRYMLFEQNTPDNLIIIKEKIKDTINSHEPRVNIQDVVVNSEMDSHSVSVTLTFYVINKQDPVVLNLTLERIR